MTARVSMLLKSRASLTCFRAYFLPGRAKDLSAPRENSKKFHYFKMFGWSILNLQNLYRITKIVIQHNPLFNSTYLLTPWCRVPLEKLTGLQLVKKFPAFHITRRFITTLTSVRHLSLSWASPIQSIYPHPTSWRSILILSIHLRLGLPIGLLPSGFPTKTLYMPSPHPYAPHAQPISFFSILSPAQYWVRSTDN